MQTYKSHYKEMTFFVGVNQFKFRDGLYTTNDKETQEVLNASPFAHLVEEEEAPKSPAKKKNAK